jgi:phosphate transport system permease protein
MNSATPQTNKDKRPIDVINAGLRRRYRAERRFRWYGKIAIGLGLAFLAILFTSIISNGYMAFVQTKIKLDVNVDPQYIAPVGTTDHDTLNAGNYGGAIKASLRKMFPEVHSHREKRELYGLVSGGAAFELRQRVLDDPKLIGKTITMWVPADDDVDMLIKGGIDRDLPENERRIKDKPLQMIERLEAEDRVALKFNDTFFTHGDSRDPEMAGIWGAASGSFFTILVTLLLSFPLGVAAAVYLEEFAPKNRITDIIEVNINNLAAVPSIVFGLLGLAVFLNFFELPRSAPLVGGMVLTLMTLPTIIISARAALRSVPPSIREAALGVGASPMQAMFYHTLPLAMPGMMTGTIIGMAQALGETAPLLMIGMVAFIVDIPGGIFDPATVLPVQIYLWADSPERGFVELTSAAIMVLLAFLIVMNLLAVFLRKRFERRW